MAKDKASRFTLKERSWILYDWANSVYATNIMAAIFPTIFVSMAGSGGDYWWSIGTSITTLLVAILSPFLGALAAFKGMKKKLFTSFMLLGVATTASLAFMTDWRMMLAGYVISHIGFSGANLFYDSFLTDVTTNERMDKVSSWGFAMGYIGGSTIPFVLSIAMLLWLGYANPIAQKFAILITSLWWLGFSIPFLKNVDQVHYIERGQGTAARQTFSNVWHTAKEIARNKGLLLFVIAYFFYIDGVGTVISISTAYGTALGLGAVGMILALLVTQIVAMPSSILFGKLAQRFTTRRMLLCAIAVYMVICGVGFYMGFSLEPSQDAFDKAYTAMADGSSRLAQEALLPDAPKAIDGYLSDARALMLGGKAADLAALELKLPDAGPALTAPLRDQLLQKAEGFAGQNAALINDYRSAIRRSTLMFWAMAILVGTVQGGIQAVSRSYFGKLVPKERSSEYFGFFDIFGKFATFVGPLLYARIGMVTGRSSLGTLALLALFLIGFILLIAARKPLEELERSKEAEAS